MTRLRRATARQANDEFRIPRPAIGERDNRIVCAHIAINRDAIETLRNGRCQRFLKQAGLNRRIGRDEGKHSRVFCSRPALLGRARTATERRGYSHSRLNHPRAFANSADSNCRSSNLELDRDFLSARIACHDRFGRGARVFRRPG